MDTENFKEKGCLQRDSAEREEYAGACRSFRRIWKERGSAEPELLEEILSRGNLNEAYKRVKANKGAPGIDGMTIEEALPYLREQKDELRSSCRYLSRCLLTVAMATARDGAQKTQSSGSRNMRKRDTAMR